MSYEVTPQPLVETYQTVQPVRSEIVQPAVAVQPVQPVYETRPAAATVATTYHRRFAVDSFIVGVIGLALTIVGLIAATRAGFDGPIDQPVVSVIGFNHTALLGLIEAAIGILLLIAAASTSRPAAIFFGLVLGIGGIVAAAQTDSFRRTLAIESSLSWLLAIAGAVVVLVSLLIPRITTDTSRVESI